MIVKIAPLALDADGCAQDWPECIALAEELAARTYSPPPVWRIHELLRDAAREAERLLADRDAQTYIADVTEALGKRRSLTAAHLERLGRRT